MADGESSAPPPMGPAVRSSTTEAAMQNRPENRFGRGNQLKMRRTPSPWFEFNVTVVDLTYNETRRGWDYQVRDDSTKLVYPNWVAEKDLKR